MRYCRSARPIRIAFCITDLDVGGAEQMLYHLATGLDRRRWSPAVFSLSPPGEVASDLDRAGIPVRCLGARHSWDVAVVWRLYRSLRWWRPRLLQTFLFHANIAGRIAGRWAGVPVIVSGARVAERRSRWPLVMDNLSARLADACVCVSQGVARFTRRQAHWPRSRLCVISNGVRLERFQNAAIANLSEVDVPSGAVVTIFVGRLDEQKGVSDLLEAIALINNDGGCNIHLLVVGQGPLRADLQRRAAEWNLTNRVHFLGWRNDVPELLKAGHMLVLPSRWEGMPNVVLEAMAAGLPVVATRVEGTEELVLPNETGLLVPAADPRALAEALILLANSSDLRLRMGQAAQRRAAQQFDLTRMVSRHEALYERLLGWAGTQQ